MMAYKDKEVKQQKNKEFLKAHYQNNKQYYRDKNKRRKLESKEFIASFKENWICKCGESHPATINFHHRDPHEKEVTISMMINKGWGKERMRKEIEKCDIICSNCHMKLHYEEKLGLGSNPSFAAKKGNYELFKM